MNSDDDLDAWLATMADEPIPDQGFSAAVMRRVQHEALPARARAGGREVLAAPSALALLERRARIGARQARWRRAGLGVGVALAGLLLATHASVTSALQPTQWFALAVAAAVSAAVLTGQEA